MTQKYCIECGAVLAPAARFCGSCGSKFDMPDTGSERELEDEITVHSDASSPKGQNRQGYIYALVNASLNGVVKIGRTSRDPENRVREISSATGVPTPFILVYKEYFDDCYTAEKVIHAHLENKHLRVNSNREFFSITVNDGIEVIKKIKTELEFKNDEGMDYNSPEYQQKLIDELVTKGYSLIRGHNEIKDPTQGIKFLERAVELGSSEACLKISEAYDGYHSIEGNLQKQLEYLKQGSRYSDIYGLKCLVKQADMHTPNSVDFDNYQKGHREAVVFNSETNPSAALVHWKLFFESPLLDDMEFVSKYHQIDMMGFYLVSFLSLHTFAQKPGYSTFLSGYLPKALQIMNMFKYDMRSTLMDRLAGYENKEALNNIQKEIFNGLAEVERKELLALENLFHFEHKGVPALTVFNIERIEDALFLIKCNIDNGLATGDLIVMGDECTLLQVESIVIENQCVPSVGNVKEALVTVKSFHDIPLDELISNEDNDLLAKVIGSVRESVPKNNNREEDYDLDLEELAVVNENHPLSPQSRQSNQLTFEGIAEPTPKDSPSLFNKIKKLFS
jgi:hypothetical protein